MWILVGILFLAAAVVVWAFAVKMMPGDQPGEALLDRLLAKLERKQPPTS